MSKHHKCEDAVNIKNTKTRWRLASSDGFFRAHNSWEIELQQCNSNERYSENDAAGSYNEEDTDELDMTRTSMRLQ